MPNRRTSWSTTLTGTFKRATTQQTRSRRINLRAGTLQENLIRTGAKIRGVNMTDFILESACTRAEQIIADQTTFVLSPQQWKAFTEGLDRPPMLHPKPPSRDSFPSRLSLKAAEWFHHKPSLSLKD